MSGSASSRTRIWDILDRGILREMGLPMLVVSLVLFVSAMTLLGANVSELRQSYMRVQHSNTALLELEGVDNDILRIEMVVRGYVLSDNPIYLIWMQSIEGKLHDRVAGFDALFGDYPEQRQRLAQLRQLLLAHNAYFEGLAKRAKTERGAVVGEILAYGKKVGRKGIEDTLVDMRSAEMKALAREQASAESRVVSAYRYALGMSALALVLAGLGFGLLVHDRKRRRH
ncbi:CHASE3 domain sensor protein [Rhizomicrobium palustre]|uniref:CHASE3 domain sensor protein n=1 Tax=Rhizomicrobium palustre TaxID=189966 RepID=A0A846N1B8_9PROT|nr:CHASE3 domain-containing protein [Rhizomicrobium palustre]NIK89279.1 CHASE3 domain sensor protein [Rhizomicrobium palustre]